MIEPKSLAGRRTVPLLAILRDYLVVSLEMTGRSGEDLLFGRTTEEAFYASTIDHRAKRSWKVANERVTAERGEEEAGATSLRPITLHECRHTFASLLIDAGANPKAIQQFMGHSKIQTTFDVYGHLLPGSHDEVRERMDLYLGDALRLRMLRLATLRGAAVRCPAMPRRPDPFKPDPGAVYTNGEVNRAGQLLRRWYMRSPGQTIDDFGATLDDLVDAMIAVTWWRSLHARPLSRVAANLRYHAAAEEAAVQGRIDVTQRLKRRPTIFNKLEREPTMQLTQMWDIGGVRARLPSLRHVQAVSRRLRKTWTIVRTKDYIKEPRSSGYRAIHHIVRRDGRLIEVQLRTVLQDAWANQVEEDSRRLATGYKFGRGGEDVHDYYRIVSEAFAALDRDEDLSPDLVAAINENYANVAETLQRRPPRGDR